MAVQRPREYRVRGYGENSIDWPGQLQMLDAVTRGFLQQVKDFRSYVHVCGVVLFKSRASNNNSSDEQEIFINAFSAQHMGVPTIFMNFEWPSVEFFSPIFTNCHALINDGGLESAGGGLEDNNSTPRRYGIRQLQVNSKFPKDDEVDSSQVGS